MRRDYRGREDGFGVACEIVEGDKADIRDSDALIALVNVTHPSAGTLMEILFAHVLGLPIAVWVEGAELDPVTWRPTERVSPWIVYHATFMGGRLEDCIAFLWAYGVPSGR